MSNTHNLLKVESTILLKIEFTQAQNTDNLLPIVESAFLKMTEEATTAKYADFAERLNELMRHPESAVKTVRRLQAIAGVSYEMARRYTLGTAKPRDEKLGKIAFELGVSPGYLDHGAGDNPSQSQSQGGQSQSQNQGLSPRSRSLDKLIKALEQLEATNSLSPETIDYLLRSAQAFSAEQKLKNLNDSKKTIDYPMLIEGYNDDGTGGSGQ